jgi:uncharacterized repeat protein (TIGR01451 family)
VLVATIAAMAPVLAAPPAPEEVLAPDLSGIPTEPMPVVTQLLDQVSQAQLITHICELQDDDNGPDCNSQGSRWSHRTEALDEAVDYVAGQFNGLGLSVEYDPFIWDSSPMTNVVATLAGTDPTSQDVYIICAHMDSIALRETGWDGYTDPAPGADDNASGTAAVLEAARVLSGYNFAHTVRFIAFAGEEQGLRGSAHYAAEAVARGDQIAGVINLDMIAWDGNQDERMELHAGTDPDSIAIAQHLASVTGRYELNLQPLVFTTTSTGASDHASFWAWGYPAILAIEDTWNDFNPYWHTFNDTLDKLDPDYLTRMAKAAIGALAEMAGPVAPDLAVMQAGPDIVVPGQTITYTLTCTNTGSAPASGVVLTDTLPSELTYVNDSSGLPATQVGGSVEWDLGALAQDQAISFVLTVTIASGITDPTTVTSTLSVVAGQAELLAGNNQVSFQTLICQAHAADYDDDGVVDADDLTELSGHWHAEQDGPRFQERFDLNNDGVINVLDAQLAASWWGEECTTSH